MESKSRINVWTTLKDRVTDSLEEEGKKLRITLLEIEQLSNTIEELSKIKGDYHPDHLALSEGSASIGQIQRNWNFVANIEDAIRKTNEQRLFLKKKERKINKKKKKPSNNQSTEHPKIPHGLPNGSYQVNVINVNNNFTNNIVNNYNMPQ